MEKRPTFTKKHFEAIVPILCDLNLPTKDKFHIALRFCQAFQRDNKRFIPENFMLAVFSGVENPQRKEVK